MISEHLHDGFNIGGSNVTVGNFHEVKEALNSWYDQGVNIIKEVCKDFFWDRFLEIEEAGLFKVDQIVTEIELLTVEFLLESLLFFRPC